MGRNDEAQLEFAQAIRLNPYNPKAHNSIAAFYSRLEIYEEAIDNYQRAIELKPDYADAIYNLGGVLAMLSRYNEAIEYWQRVLILQPELLNLLPKALKDAITNNPPLSPALSVIELRALAGVEQAI